MASQKGEGGNESKRITASKSKFKLGATALGATASSAASSVGGGMQIMRVRGGVARPDTMTPSAPPAPPTAAPPPARKAKKDEKDPATRKKDEYLGLPIAVSAVVPISASSLVTDLTDTLRKRLRGVNKEDQTAVIELATALSERFKLDPSKNNVKDKAFLKQVLALMGQEKFKYSCDLFISLLLKHYQSKDGPDGGPFTKVSARNHATLELKAAEGTRSRRNAVVLDPATLKQKLKL